VRLGGVDITAVPPDEKLKTSRLGYVLQKDSVFADMTVEENLLMGAICSKLKTRPRRPPSGCSIAIRG
jgi:ABC-type branched-subunit amino acid transport system ATPase component